MKLVHSVYFPLKEGRSILGSLIWLDLGENIVWSPFPSPVDPLEDACWFSKKSFVCWINSCTSALKSQAVLSSACRRSSGTNPLSIDLFHWSMWESLLWQQEKFASPQDLSLDRTIGLSSSDRFAWKSTSCDHLWSEPTSGMFVLADRFVHVARSQQLVDRSARSHCSDLVARSPSFVDRTSRCYHS